MKEINVLFIDDEEDIVYSLGRMFKYESYGVIATSSIDEAYKAIEENPIKLVVSDQCMPDITGVELLKKIKESKPDTIRILLSGQADSQDMEDAINVGGIYRFIHKPCEPAAVKKIIREALYHYDLISQNKELLDLTSQKNEELEKMNMKLSSLYKKQKEVSSIVSHELRTPLASIKTAIDIVMSETSGKLNDNQNKFLVKAKKNVDRLKRLIDEVLDLSQLESGKIELKLEKHDISHAIEEVIDVNLAAAQEKGIYLKMDVQEGLLPVTFDADRINQVLNNLVTNAVKFTQEGGITIIAKGKNDNLEIKVKDTGAGINSEDIAKLFEKFQQLEGTVKGGSGLGLAICKEIILQHKGKIWVTSEAGDGSEFCFILPMT